MDLTTILFLSWLMVILFFLGLAMLRSDEDSQLLKLMTQSRNWREAAETFGPLVSTWLPIFNMPDIEQKLVWAGRPMGLSAVGFVGLKGIALMLGLVFGLFLVLLKLPPFFLLVAVVLAYLLPDSFLRSACEKRQKEIYKTFPIMVSLLQTAISAGVELGPALAAISRNFPGPLGDELRIAWKEAATGRFESAALAAMAKRTGVPVVIRFFDTLNTARERGGVDLSLLIEDFRHDLVESQRRQVQEQAKKVPTKMLLPMFVCIFIPTLLLILVPVMLNLFRVL